MTDLGNLRGRCKLVSGPYLDVHSCERFCFPSSVSASLSASSLSVPSLSSVAPSRAAESPAPSSSSSSRVGEVSQPSQPPTRPCRCCTSGFGPLQVMVTFSGVTPTQPVGSQCDQFNNTFILTWLTYGGQVPRSCLWAVGFEPTIQGSIGFCLQCIDFWEFSLDCFTTSNVPFDYQGPVLWDCASAMTLVYQGNAINLGCKNWPATIQIIPV